MRKRRGQNGEKVNIKSIVRTGVAYQKEERKEQKKRKNRNKSKRETYFYIILSQIAQV